MREDREVDTADVPFTAADMAAALAWEARRDAVTALWQVIAARIEAEAKRRHKESIKARSIAPTFRDDFRYGRSAGGDG